MKNPFNRIVGPDGESSDPGKGDFALGEREAFALRCLNAAANLYGILTVEEFCTLYNNYAKDRAAPVSETMDVDEAEKLARSIRRKVHGNRGPNMDKSLPESWYGVLEDCDNGEPLIVCEKIYDSPPAFKENMDDKRRRVATWRDHFIDEDIKILDADEFFANEEYAEYPENIREAADLARFIMDDFGLDEKDAEDCVFDVVSSIRENGVDPEMIREVAEELIPGRKIEGELCDRIVERIEPVRRTTRAWRFRGRTLDEIEAEGVDLRKYDHDDYDDDDYDDGYDDDDELEMGSIEELPPAKYTGPVDFKFVKDPVERDRALYDYDGVRAVTREFVRNVVMYELTSEERRDAARRLGFVTNSKTGKISDPTLDMVTGDFASMMDDQHGEPAIKRILKRKDKLGEYNRAAAEYYENYRYTWLEVLAVKTGVGVKCRNLLTDEELFLMEKSFSRGDVKGTTVCAGIAPMGKVYLALGCLHPANFENPAVILKIVLSHLGLPTETPIQLSLADQARFAVETIRRINANGKFSRMIMG